MSSDETHSETFEAGLAVRREVMLHARGTYPGRQAAHTGAPGRLSIRWTRSRRRD